MGSRTKSWRWALAMAIGVPLGSAGSAGELSRSASRLRADVAYLADDAREGRGPGTAGIDAAADYIAKAYEAAGLKPAPGAEGYFQPFAISGPTRLGKDQSLAATVGANMVVRGEMRRDFAPLAIGSGGKFADLPVVFAGYGITASDPAAGLDYDDYAGLDVKGKAVLILRRAPGHEKAEGPFAAKDGQPSSYATFLHKVTNAAEHGAKALFVVNDQAGLVGADDELLVFTAAGTSRFADIPVAMLSRAYVTKLLGPAGAHGLDHLEAKILGDGKKPTPAGLDLEGKLRFDGTISIDREVIACKNVVGVLEGEGPAADETIVIGAHYDHLGRGGFGSLAPLSRDVHNGADDNASGTALILELARRLGARPDPLPRRIVFIAFSGEERGLLGSKHYVENPLFPIDTTAAMLNFDMVGRLNDKNELTLFGAGSLAGLTELTEALGASQGLKIKPIAGASGEFAASDHYSFYQAGLPVFFAFTGSHADYHRPGDDTEKVNVEGMARIANLAELVALDLAQRAERPQFVKLAEPRVGALTRGGGSGAYFGSRPAYGEEDVIGVKLDGVTEGSPADKAGLKKGDVIVKFAGRPVTSLETYMEAMGGKKPGDVVEVVVERDGQKETLKATLGTRPAQAGN